METKQNEQHSNVKRNERIYRVSILILGIMVVGFAILWFTSRQSLQEMTTEREVAEQLNRELQHELDSVLDEYYMVKLEYDSILVEQDSIIQANAQEIQRLIARQADYNRIRRQLNMLREITQNYVHEIDSLYTENRVLKAENIQMREEIQQVQRRTTQLTQDKQVLESKVEEAATLRALQFEPVSFRIRGRDREDETDRAHRAEQIRVCFTIAENPITPPGVYNAYMRIAGPSGNILRLSDDFSHAFVYQGDTLQFSAKESFRYDNAAKDLCLTWQRIEEFDPGVYSISLYTDEYRLGETALQLR